MRFKCEYMKERVQIIRGQLFPRNEYFTKENIEAVLDYIPKDGDVIITAFPKTGSTWLIYTALQILSKGECFPSLEDLLLKIAPMMEISGIKAINALVEPRIYRTHVPYNMLRMNDKAKYLYIYRKPEDALVSYYHFLRNVYEHDFDFDQFFEDYVSGSTDYGFYFDHVNAALSFKSKDNILFVSYEKLLKNTVEEIQRISMFLGEEYFKTLNKDKCVLDKILQNTTFENMKTNLHFPAFPNQETPEFFRKGKIGEGHKLLSPDQLQTLMNTSESAMRGTEIFQEWTEQ